MKKNTAGQYWDLYAYHANTSVPATGIAATITATINKDDAGEVSVGSGANPTELTKGRYRLPLTQEETNAYKLSLNPSSTANGVLVRALPETLSTETAAAVDPAPGSTALSNAVWTETKAGYIDGAITSRQATVTNLANTVTMAAAFANMHVASVYTAAALVNAPTGGGTAPTVEQIRSEMDSNSTKLASILEDTGTTLPAQIAALDIGGGTGTYACVWTVNDGTTVLQNATVSFWLGGVLKGTGTTGVAGTVSMSLDAGTYTVAITCDGYTFANTTHAVSSTASTWTKTFSMSSQVWPTSTVPGTTTVRWRVRKTNRAWASTAECTVYMGISKGPGVAGTIYNGDNLDYDSDTTDASGYVYFANTPKGATVAVKTATDGQVQFVKIPADCGSTFDGLELIGSS